MDQSANSPSREQQIFWSEFTQLKTDACYIRDYRNSLNNWVTVFAAIRAIASTSSIGAWLIWKRYALLWQDCLRLHSSSMHSRTYFLFIKGRGP